MKHVDDKLLLVAKKMCSPDVFKLYEFEYRNPQAVNLFNMIFGTVYSPFESAIGLSMFEGYFPKIFILTFYTLVLNVFWETKKHFHDLLS